MFEFLGCFLVLTVVFRLDYSVARRYLGCPELVLLSVVVDRLEALQRWVPRDRVE